MTNRTTRTGPRTPEGKKRASLNSLKHGFYAKSPHVQAAVDAEVGIDFDDILAQMEERYCPADAVESRLIRRIAVCFWRLARAEAMEKLALQWNPRPKKPGITLDRILRYERLVDIHLHRAMAVLEARRSQTK